MRARPSATRLSGLCCVGLVCGALSVPAGAAQDTGVSEVGFFTPSVVNPVYVGDVAAYRNGLRLVVDAPSRTLLAVDRTGGVAQYDLDTLRARSTAVLDTGGAPQTAVDEPEQARVLLAVASGGQGTATTSIQALELQHGRLVDGGRLAIGPTDLGGPEQAVVALAPQPGSTRVYALSMSFAASLPVPRSVHVSLLDLAGIRTGAARTVWSTALSGCITTQTPGAGIFETGAFGLSSATAALYVGCSTTGGTPGLPAKSPDPVGVARLALDPGSGSSAPQAGATTFFPFPGVINGMGVWDPAASRLVLEANTNGSAETLYSFDTATNRYVGAVGVGNNALAALGADLVHHRMYALGAGTGLVAADLEPLPVDAGQLYRAFATHRGSPLPMPALPVDPRTGRLFLNYGLGGFTVLRDAHQYYERRAAQDPDAGTSDLPESPTRTGASVAAEAQAYGAVYRQVGGVHNLLVNAVVVDPGDTLPVSGGTRELDAAYLHRLTLDTGSVSGAAIGLDRDRANTQADEGKVPPGTPVAWPFTSAACSDFGGTPRSSEASDARVTCNAGSETVTSTAAVGLTQATSGVPADGVAVSRAEYTAALQRTRLGSVSTVTTTVQGVSVLGGVLRIGRVQVVAQARAHGRPGTAAASFTRSVTGVELNGTPLCTAECDLTALADEVNTALAGRVHIEFPQPDATLAKGSPRGAVAMIRRSTADQLEEVLVNQQDPSRVEVPGVEVTLYQDNTLPERTVVMLAGAGVEAHYQIYPLAREARGSSPVPPVVRGGLPVPSLSGPSAPAVTPVVAADAQPRAASPRGPLSGVLDTVRLRWNGLPAVLRLLAVWSVLLLPVYLSSRRWLLLRRGSRRAEGVA
jgi:hypothetical protein